MKEYQTLRSQALFTCAFVIPAAMRESLHFPGPLQSIAILTHSGAHHESDK
jgi:hypothetical protein